MVLCTKQPPSFSINHNVQTCRCDQCVVFGFSGSTSAMLGFSFSPSLLHVCCDLWICADDLADILRHTVAAWWVDAVRGRFSQPGSVNPEV